MFALKEGSEQLWSEKKDLSDARVENSRHLKVPKLNKTIKQFLYIQRGKNNFLKYAVN